MLAFVVVLLVLAAVALVIAVATRTARRVPSIVAVVSEAPPPEPLPEPAAEVPALSWTAELTAETLDAAARLRLIDDLVLLGDEWAIALLRRALEEEQAPDVRERLADALVKIPGAHLLGRT
jgi:hypothetical protein